MTKHKITTTQQKVAQCFYNEGAWDGYEGGHFDGHFLLNYQILEKKTGFKLTQLRRAVRGLKLLGLVKHSPAINQDGQPSGSGFCITEEGLNYIIRDKENE